jgi:hypothetical protein
MRLARALLLAVVVLGLHRTAARADFSYPDFSSLAGLQLNGNAAQAGTALRLTPATFFQGGSAFTTASTPLGSANSFSTYFQFQITNSGGIGDPDGIGADGIVFVIQTVSNNVGAAGGGLGYQGIPNSVGIEFDTYYNFEHDPLGNGNHVGINLNGTFSPSNTVLEPIRFNDGQVWNAWVDYNGATDGLEVRWSLNTLRPVLAQHSATVDLEAVLGQNTAFLGFTAGTGSGWGNQDILRWEFVDSFAPIGNEPVPEPASLLLWGVGGLGLVAFRRRRGARQVFPSDLISSTSGGCPRCVTATFCFAHLQIAVQFGGTCLHTVH